MSTNTNNFVRPRDLIVSRSHLIHPALFIASPETALGNFELKFLQFADESVLKDIFNACEEKSISSNGSVYLHFTHRSTPSALADYINPVAEKLSPEKLVVASISGNHSPIYEDDHTTTYYIAVEV